MIEFAGVPLEDDEYTFMIIDGEPEVMVNRKGFRKLAEHAPDPQKRAAALAYLDGLEAES